MRIGITAMPADNFLIQKRPFGPCNIQLYKDLETTQSAEYDMLTADVVSFDVQYFDGLEDDIKANFEYYFEREKAKELQILKLQKLEEVKNALFASALQTDFSTIKSQIDAATSEEALEAIKV